MAASLRTTAAADGAAVAQQVVRIGMTDPKALLGFGDLDELGLAADAMDEGRTTFSAGSRALRPRQWLTCSPHGCTDDLIIIADIDCAWMLVCVTRSGRSSALRWAGA